MPAAHAVMIRRPSVSAASPPRDRTERQRQAALDAYSVLDTGAEQPYDDIVWLAATLCATPAAMICLLDRQRQWLKARWHVDEVQAPRRGSPCEYAAQAPGQVFEVADLSTDERFVGEGGLRIDGRSPRFYAGMPICSPDGQVLGALSVLDLRPRVLEPAQREGLEVLARQTEYLLELRRHALEQQRLLVEREASTRHLEHARDELQQRHEQLQHHASHDPLTGLLNRSALAELRGNPRAMAQLQRAPYTLLLVDVDHFKQVNDRHGHLLGDRALRAVGDAIAASTREGDVAVRFGGEEFLVVLPNTRLSGAAEVAERIRLQVAQLSLPFALTVSIGLASGEPDRDRPEQVFDRADQALYRAKAAGRDRVVADDTLHVSGESL